MNERRQQVTSVVGALGSTSVRARANGIRARGVNRYEEAGGTAPKNQRGDMARRHQKWASGDVFLIPLEDEGKRFAVGQVVAPEPKALNSVGIVLGKHAVSTPEEALALTLDESELILMKLTTRESLDRRLWSVVGRKTIAFPMDMYPWRGATSFVGVKIYGSGLVTEFVQAFFGYGPWDAYLDPGYLDKMLIDPALKPISLKYKKDFPKDDRA